MSSEKNNKILRAGTYIWAINRNGCLLPARIENIWLTIDESPLHVPQTWMSVSYKQGEKCICEEVPVEKMSDCNIWHISYYTSEHDAKDNLLPF